MKPAARILLHLVLPSKISLMIAWCHLDLMSGVLWGELYTTQDDYAEGRNALFSVLMLLASYWPVERFDPMSVVHKPVEDCVCKGVIADCSAPLLCRQLADDDR